MSTPTKTATALIAAARQLREDVDRLQFSAPVAYVYNPLNYAWKPHAAYLKRFGGSRSRVIFLGMNPGPWGMAQVGVPFGEIGFVRDWLKIDEPVDSPPRYHPKRPVEGFRCQRSEVSGRRLWGYFAERFKTPEAFFKHYFVANYCPLMFAEESGRNRTPDKIAPEEQANLFAACDRHLQTLVDAMQPEWVIGIGTFAEKQATAALADTNVRIGRILHPSPASPAANRGWSAAAEKQLTALGILPSAPSSANPAT